MTTSSHKDNRERRAEFFRRAREIGEYPITALASAESPPETIMVTTGDITEIVPTLWVGNHSSTEEALRSKGITMLVLTARQHQGPLTPQIGVEIVRCPLTDHAFRIVDGDQERAEQTALQIYNRYDSQSDCGVLITCSEGMNRSCWVAAIVLRMIYGMSGEEAISLIQERRPGALYNWFFKEHLIAMDADRIAGRDPEAIRRWEIENGIITNGDGNG